MRKLGGPFFKNIYIRTLIPAGDPPAADAALIPTGVGWGMQRQDHWLSVAVVLCQKETTSQKVDGRTSSCRMTSGRQPSSEMPLGGLVFLNLNDHSELAPGLPFMSLDVRITSWPWLPTRSTTR